MAASHKKAGAHQGDFGVAERQFRRGLTADAKARLDDMAASQSSNWWQDLLALWGPSGTGKAERPLRLAVRDNYLNFYLRGQSVARVAFDGQSRPYVDVHVKYAFEGATEQAYARLTDTGIVHPRSDHTASYSGASTMLEWMARAARWETAEKAEVERVVADNPGVIDLEMGLPAHGDQKTALRMDLIALEPSTKGARVVFWEAKRVTDARLRASSDSLPEVMEQIDAYRRYLEVTAHRGAVLRAYADTCALLADFAAAAAASRASKPLALDGMVQKVAGKPENLDLDLDSTPRLVVFGTEDQLAADAWMRHHAKLLANQVTVVTIKTDAYRLDAREDLASAAAA